MCELGTDGSRAGEGLPEDQRALRRYRLQSLDYVSSVRHPVCCPCPIVQPGRTTGARDCRVSVVCGHRRYGTGTPIAWRVDVACVRGGVRS